MANRTYIEWLSLWDQEIPGEPECLACGEVYMLHDGYELSRLCDQCAREACECLAQHLRGRPAPE